MVSGRIVVFDTDGFSADERLVRDYVVEEYDRLTGIDGVEGIGVSRAATDPDADRGGVHLAVFGDAEAVVESERDRWDGFESDGRIESWSVATPAWADWPDEQARFLKEMQTLATRMARSYFAAFGPDERPAPADAFHDSDRPLGIWFAYHVLLNLLGYGGPAEIDASFQSIRNQLRSLAESGEAGYALSRVRELQGRLGAIEEELEGIVEDADGNRGVASEAAPESVDERDPDDPSESDADQ